jgi:TATA-box binding protein (TBP) (component of TFIID and TFIIIB)
MENSTDVDAEWENFISSHNEDDDISSNEEESVIEEYMSPLLENEFNLEIPKPSAIYISTKTKISYLNHQIDLKHLFWSIPIIPYYMPVCGVVKKQMKFNSLEVEELTLIQDNLKDVEYFEEHVITSINNPAGRIKFKDIRKVSIGVSKNDLLSYRCKKKSAFYNCFVLILRIKVDELFKEFHVKVFNTGKLEIPGIQNEDTFQRILGNVLEILQPHMVEKDLRFKENTDETVLINSNFNCGFFIDREMLNDILKNKYNIQCIYDPCSYPGIQCKFYYNEESLLQNKGANIVSLQGIKEGKTKCKNIKEVSFMIFRTGSVLIVGKCDESLLFIIYEFLKNIFIQEYSSIRQTNVLKGDAGESGKNKKKKIRKKNITVTTTTTMATTHENP